MSHQIHQNPKITNLAEIQKSENHKIQKSEITKIKNHIKKSSKIPKNTKNHRNLKNTKLVRFKVFTEHKKWEIYISPQNGTCCVLHASCDGVKNDMSSVGSYPQTPISNLRGSKTPKITTISDSKMQFSTSKMKFSKSSKIRKSDISKIMKSEIHNNQKSQQQKHQIQGTQFHIYHRHKCHSKLHQIHRTTRVPDSNGEGKGQWSSKQTENQIINNTTKVPQIW